MAESPHHPLLDTILPNLPELIPVGIWIVDADGQIVYTNAAGRTIWRAAPDMPVQQWHEFKARSAGTGGVLGPDQWPAVRAVRDGVIVLKEELEIDCFDGSRRFTLNSALPVRDPDGHIIGALSIDEDVTGLKRAQRDLRGAHEILNRALHIARMFVWRWNSATDQIVLEGETKSILGLTQSESLDTGQKALTILFPEDVPAIEKLVHEAVDNRTPFMFQTRIQHRISREVRWLEVQGQVSVDPEDGSVSITGVALDVTARKEAEEDAAAVRQRLDAALRNARIQVFTQDRDLRYLWVHKDVLTLPGDQAIGKTDRDLFDETLAARLTALKQRTMEQRSGTREEIAVPQDSHDMWFELHAEVLLNTDGSTAGVVCVAIDITEHKALQQSLQTLVSYSSEPMALITETGTIENINAEAARLLNMEPEQLRGTPAMDLVHPEEQLTIRMLLNDARRMNDKKVTATCRLRLQDGSYRWFFLDASPASTTGTRSLYLVRLLSLGR